MAKPTHLTNEYRGIVGGLGGPIFIGLASGSALWGIAAFLLMVFFLAALDELVLDMKDEPSR